MGDRDALLILAQRASWEDRFQVSSLAASTAAAGKQVDVAFFFGALDAWARGEWDRLDPTPPIDAQRLGSLPMPPLSEILLNARTDDQLRLYACSASVRILGLDPQLVQVEVDAILGWQSFSRMIGDASSVVTF
ncbi:MAG: hypothetical protein VYE73_03955 [Acidobacteriota bacterium]|nr:hypothetical protein [Acidobacteriota bacterium]